MNITNRLLATIIGGLVLWAITSVISYYTKKTHIRKALLADIEIHIAGAKEQTGAVGKLIEDQLVEGKIIPFPISYNVGEYSLYKALQKDLPTYLNNSEIVKLIKFYQALWEMDISINGLASTLATWEKEKVTLSKEQIEHAKKRGERIKSYCGALTAKNIKNLSDLPDDYRAVKGAETVVAKN